MELKYKEEDNVWYYLNNGSWLYIPTIVAKHINDQAKQIKELEELLIEVESVEGHYNGVVFSEDLQDRLSDTIMKLNKH